MARRYQQGGEVEDEELGFGLDLVAPQSGGGILGQLDPSTALFGILAQQYTTTPEAQNYSRRILNEMLAEQGAAPESTALSAMRTQAEQVRAALRAAREKVLKQEFNRGDALLAVSAALGRPTRTGSLGEVIGNVSEALREPVAKRREFERSRDEAVSELELALAQADQPVYSAEFELEKLQQQLKNRLAVEALQNLGKTTLSTRGLGGVIPESAKALDAAYVKDEYIPFITGGSAKAAQGLGTLRFASQQLKSGQDTLTGPYVGTAGSLPVVGRGLQDFLWPAGSDVRDMIEQTVQESLRPILGSQFTQQEGERLIARIFNPRLEEWRNARRLDWFIQQLERAYQSKTALAQYYQQNQTLFGYEGPIGYSVEDFVPPPSVGTEEEAIPFGDLPPEQQEAVRQEYRQRTGQEPNFKVGGRVRYRLGGRVRRYQRGGPVILPDGSVFERDEPVESPGLEDLKSYWEALGYAPSAVAGGVVGLGSEALLDRIAKRVMGGTPSYRVDEAIRRGGLEPPEELAEIRRSRRMGVPSQIMDIDTPPVQVLAEEAFRYGGPEADEALENLRERVEGSRERVSERVNRGLKPYEYFDHEDRYVNQTSSQARQQLMAPVFEKYPGLPMDPVISDILNTPIGKQATDWAFRFYQNVPGRTIGKEDVTGLVQKPSLEFYDYIVKGLDQVIAREEKSGPTEFSGVARDLRKQMVDRLDKLAPGEYREARHQYGGDLEIRDALREGLDFNRQPPEQLARRAQGMSFHEKNAFRTGMAQALYNMLDRSSAEGFNAAQKLIGSPAMVAKLEPFFDSSSEFRLFQEALKKEAELFRTGSRLASRGESLRMAHERQRVSPLEYAAQKGPGFRFAISPVGWFLRIYRDLPKLSPKKATQILEILQKGDPEEMEAFAQSSRRLGMLRRTRTPRRMAAAAVGAGLGALFGGPDEEPE